MLGKTLLATSALVLCASLARAGQQAIIPMNGPALAKMFGHGAQTVHGAPAVALQAGNGRHPLHNSPPHLEGAIFSNYSRDANAQYISWYAGFSASNLSTCYSSSGYHSCFHITKENALAFTPATSVTTRNVTVPVWAFVPTVQFRVDIYSSVGGLPGAVIARSKKFTASDTWLCCTASRTVAIKANLTGGKQYFIGVAGVSSDSSGGWFMENTDFSGASVDYFLDRETGTYGSTPNEHYFFSNSGWWHRSTLFPVTGAVVLK